MPGRPALTPALTSVLTLVLVLSGLACLGGAVRHRAAAPAVDASGKVANAPTVGPAEQASKPVSITIARIGVRSPVRRVGLTATGEMQVPAPGPHYDEAAWYRYSPAPGSPGPAVIVGHTDSATNGPSVFARLGGLRPKDTVQVARADGSTVTFAVDGVREFRKDRFPTRLVYGDTGGAALRLISCGGRFDRKTGHYADNIVVFASLRSVTRSVTRSGPL